MRPMPEAARALTLSREAVTRANAVRVLAHASSVIVRKRGAEWVTAGQNGCVVDRARMARALDALTRLKATRTGEASPDGDAYGLQIAVETDAGLALRFDVADRNAQGDLVRLGDNSTARVLGLDRELWSPRPADWCADAG